MLVLNDYLKLNVDRMYEMYQEMFEEIERLNGRIADLEEA